MPEKKKVYCKFEGIIVPSSSGEGLAETDKAWLVEISIPERYSGEQIWIAKSMVKPNIKVSGDLIQGSTESWIFKKLDKKEFESAQTTVDTTHPYVGTAVEVIQPFKEGVVKIEHDLGTLEYTKVNPLTELVVLVAKSNEKLDKIIELMEMS